MGGEPTLHPEFRRFVEYAAKNHPMRYNAGGGHKPIKSLSKYMYDMISLKTHPLNNCQGLGLWSSVCGTYAKHYETIQDNFIYQCINDHTASSRHQAWLLTRKEFGIEDDEWIKMRDNCWWQRWLGSPSITPKGAFFCEVAAAMDMLFDGPGGWPIEKGWWKRGVEDFGEQLKWCEFCAGAFISFDRDANEQADDVSPVMYEKLKTVGSPKLNRPGRVIVHSVGQDSDIEIKPRDYMLMYQTDPELRFTDKNKALYPAGIHAVYFVDNLAGIDETKLKQSIKQFDGATIVCKDSKAKEYFADWSNVAVFDKDFSFGKQLWLATRAEKGWIALFKTLPKNIVSDFRDKINRTIFNPGTIHYFVFEDALFFHKDAQAFVGAGFDNIGRCLNADEFVKLWPKEKYCELGENFDEIINGDIEEWEENVRMAGIMEWNRMRPVIDELIVRRRVEPKIKSICDGTLNYAEKLQQIATLHFSSVLPPMMCDKIKTAVHNETAKALSANGYDIAKVKTSLLNSPKGGYCCAYALALLSHGEERKNFLKKCIADSKNIYGVGAALLRELYLQSENNGEKSFFDELIAIAKNKPSNVLLGNRYVGKSLSMILSALNLPAVCFCDDEREGYDYDGLHTRRADDVLAKGENYNLIVCVKGRLNRQIMTAVRPFSNNMPIIELKDTTYKELSRTMNIESVGVNIGDLANEAVANFDDNAIKKLLHIE